MRTFLLGLLGLFVVAVVGFLAFAPAIADGRMNPVTPHDPWPVSDTARELHARLLVGDLHADTLLWNRDWHERSDVGHIDIPRLMAGNVALQVFTAVTRSPRGLNYDHNAADAPDNITLLALAQLWPPRTWGSLLERALWQAGKLDGIAADSSGRLRVIRTVHDLDLVLESRGTDTPVIGGLLGIEGAHPLEGDLGNVAVLAGAGYRLIALQHFFDNDLGGSLHGDPEAGLTDFGRAVVREVEAQGLILDVAHSSPAVVRDVLDMVRMPIVLSHTGIASQCASRRNIPDDLLQGIAATGGVVGIGFWADVTCDDSPAGVAAAIVAAVDLLGPEHVALGSDYDGTVRVAFDASELAALTQALMDAGLPEDTIAAVMGGNMERVLRARLRMRP